MIKLFSLPIRLQLFLIVLCMAIFSMTIIVYAGVHERTNVIDDARQEMQSFAAVIAVQQQALTATTEQLLSTLSRMPELRQRNVSKLQAALAEIIGLNPAYSTIFITDSSGEIWCSALPTKAQKISDRESFEKTLASGQFSSGQYKIGQYSGKQVLSFYYPYKNERGEVIGVIILGIDLAYIEHLLAYFQMPSTSNYLLLDHKGIIISGGQKNYFVGQQYEEIAFNQMKNGPETDTFIATAHDGQQRLISYRKLRLDGELTPYLYVRAGIPVAAVLAQANKTLLIILGIFMACLLGVLYLAWLIGKRSITDRVALLEKSSLRLAEGDLTVRVADLVSGGELGNLGSTFDYMANQLAQREKALRRSEDNLQKIMDSSTAVIFTKDLDGKYIFINTQYEKLFHVTKAGIVGKTDYDIFPREAADAFQEADLQALQANIPIEAEEAVPQDDGIHTYLSLKFPLYDNNNRPYAVCGIATDITERKRLDEQSLKVQKLESIGTLAGGIAHDFNNLLQGVFGYISLAKMTIHNREKSISALEQAEKALHQSVKLTTQLLTFSKGGRPDKKPTDLQTVIENSAKFVLSGSRSNLRLNVPEDLWQVEADEGQIGQVIQNIVLNADQAMPEIGTVNVSAANLPEEDLASHPPGIAKGNYIMITIQDTGIGIPQKYLSKIFDPYFTTKEKGSGLGLATSYSIVKSHGGIIDVRTKSGEGSTFTIYLPAIAGKIRPASAEKPQQIIQSRRARVLVMDDDEVIRNISCDLLGMLGHDVEVAKQGQDVLEKYQRALAAGNPFDIVILDLTIRGGMGGAETVQQLIKMDPQVKAIMSSGYSDDATTENYMSQGFKASLKKPYGVEALRDVLNKILNS
jgi:PAS domain S-box-containing protein